MASNDYVQIAHGGAAIVEPQAEWAGEAGILNNGFPNGIVLQEQYNKAWRQATAWLAAWGWHSSKRGSFFNMVDDGVWQNLWIHILCCAMAEVTFYEGSTSAPNNYVIDNPDPANLPWVASMGSSKAIYGSKIVFVINNANTANSDGSPKLSQLNLFGGGFLPIVNQNGVYPGAGELRGIIELLFAGTYWIVTNSTPASIKNLSFGTVVDVLENPNSPGAGNYVGNYTVPGGVNLIQAYLIGGGGGSSVSAISTSGAVCGGGGGGSCITAPLTVTPGQVIGYVIGGGGAPSGTFNAFGSNGGNTTFNTTYQATGGGGSSTSAAGGGGGGFNGLINTIGSTGTTYGTGQLGSAGGTGGRAGGPYGGGGGATSTGSCTAGGLPGGGAGGPGSGGVFGGQPGAHGRIYILR